MSGTHAVPEGDGRRLNFPTQLSTTASSPGAGRTDFQSISVLPCKSDARFAQFAERKNAGILCGEMHMHDQLLGFCITPAELRWPNADYEIRLSALRPSSKPTKTCQGDRNFPNEAKVGSLTSWPMPGIPKQPASCSNGCSLNCAPSLNWSGASPACRTKIGHAIKTQDFPPDS